MNKTICKARGPRRTVALVLNFFSREYEVQTTIDGIRQHPDYCTKTRRDAMLVFAHIKASPVPKDASLGKGDGINVA